MVESVIYREKLSSFRSEALFFTLMAIFSLLFAWRVNSVGMDVLAGIFLVFALVFLFYSLNFRVLEILLAPGCLQLAFGIFRWRLPLENIADCRLDDLPRLMRLGGAGIHFMMIRKRYRASFNFLEYPRVVVSLRRKAGPVCDISFSTR